MTPVELEKTVALLTCAQMAIDAEIRGRISVFNTRRNTFLAINKLPDELLIEVFHRTLPTGSVAGDFKLEHIRNLARVMRRWWHIIRSSQKLWTILSPMSVKQLNMCLKKSGDSLPLSIRSIGPTGQSLQERFLRSILHDQDSAKRIESIHIDFVSQVVVQTYVKLVRKDAGNVLPGLKVLTLSQASPSGPVAAPLPASAELDEIHLSGIIPNLPPKDIPVRHVSFRDVVAHSHVWNPGKVLSRCPQLEVLEMHTVHLPRNGETHVVFAQPLKLKTLTLNDVGAPLALKILGSVDTENLVNLTLRQLPDATLPFEDSALLRALSNGSEGPSLLTRVLGNLGKPKLTMSIVSNCEIGFYAFKSGVGRISIRLQAQRAIDVLANVLNPAIGSTSLSTFCDPDQDIDLRFTEVNGTAFPPMIMSEPGRHHPLANMLSTTSIRMDCSPTFTSFIISSILGPPAILLPNPAQQEDALAWLLHQSELQDQIPLPFPRLKDVTLAAFPVLTLELQNLQLGGWTTVATVVQEYLSHRRRRATLPDIIFAIDDGRVFKEQEMSLLPQILPA